VFKAEATTFCPRDRQSGATSNHMSSHNLDQRVRHANREPCTVLVTHTATVNTIPSKIDGLLEVKSKATTFCPRAVLKVEDSPR